MDKVLRFYKIPDANSIVNIKGVVASLPQNPEAGDIYIVTSPLAMYEAIEVSSGGVTTISWYPKQFVSGTYYRDMSAEEPTYYSYSNSEITKFDTSFPSSGKIAETYSFTYSANRMGVAPKISATLMHRTCLDELWTDRVCAQFNGSLFFLDRKPSSKYSNADERYEHSIELTSERILLENVYLANIADYTQMANDDVSQRYEFSFFGGYGLMVGLINETLKYEGLYTDGIGFSVTTAQDTYTQQFIADMEEPDKMVEVSNITIKEALDQIYELWGLPYYFVGYDIYIGFSNEPQIEDAGFTMPTFEYGITNELLSIQKSQNNDIKNRITGFGSEENLPYFYPNENPGGLTPVYMRNGAEIADAVKVVNPYRLVNIDPTDNVSALPDGTYFIYEPVDKLHVFDQNSVINEQTIYILDNIDLSRQPYLSDEIRVSLPAPYQEPARFGGKHYVTKKVWVWFKDGVTTSINLNDYLLNENSTDSCPLEYLSTSGSFTYSLMNATHDQWEQMSSGNISNQAFTLSSTTLSYQFTSQGGQLGWLWSDGVFGMDATYFSRFPIDITTIPSGTTCMMFQFKAVISDYSWTHFDGQSSWRASLKNDVCTVIKQYYTGDSDWVESGTEYATSLYLHGMRLDQSVTPQDGDFIYFTQGDIIEHQHRLLPYNFHLNGDVWLNALDNTYLRQNSQVSYYDFENQYKQSCSRETIEDHDEIKPTIKGMKNGDVPQKRIDRFLDITFDASDNNSMTADGENALHSYFFVKLAKTNSSNGYGFNLFDCAVENDVMQISMTSGACGGCTFDIMVHYNDVGMPVNPIAVYDTPTTINGVTYDAGTPIRDEYGNVRFDAQIQPEMQDTEHNEVWIALKKDNSTFSGHMLPDTIGGITPTANQDTFVLLHISLPIAYVHDAETRLYYALLDSLEELNKRKYNFSVTFSSIYYKHNYSFMDSWLTEASKVPFVYNGETLEYYVTSYTYKVSSDKALPEVSINLEEQVKPRKPFILPTIDSQREIAIEVSAQQVKKYQGGGAGVSSQDASDAVFGDVRVQGSLKLNDGTDLDKQLYYLNERLFDVENTSNDTRRSWAAVTKRAEAENMFVDGTFSYGLSHYTPTGVRVSDPSDGIVSDHGLYLSMEASGEVQFDQNIPVQEGFDYTVVFFAKNESLSQIGLYYSILFYDEEDNHIDSIDTDTILVDQDETKRCVFKFSPTKNAEYCVLRLYNASESDAALLTFDGLMVFEDNYMEYDENGKLVPSILCPNGYVSSFSETSRAIEEAMQGGGGGGTQVQSDWEQTDTTAVDYIKNKPFFRMYRNLTGTAAVTTSPYYGARWDITDSSVTSYIDGMIVCLKVPVAGNGSYGTALQINSLGYKPIVYNVSSMIGTRYSVGSVVWCVYNSTQTATLYLGSGSETITGCWQVMDYDKDTTAPSNIIRYNGTRVVSNDLLRYVISFRKNLTTIVPIHSVAGTGTSANSAVTATTKTMTTESFDPFGEIYYYSTNTKINIGESVAMSALYTQKTGVDARYIFNCAKTLTANKELFLVVDLQSDNSVKLATGVNPWSQTLPSTNDGHLYILLGYTYSAYQFELYYYHPIYYHDGTKLCVYSGLKDLDDLGNVSISSPSDKQALLYDYANGIWKNSSLGKTIDTLGSSVRIWSTDPGVYLLPANCTVYYYGSSNTTYQEILYGGILFVWSKTSSLKQFVIFNHNYYGDGSVNSTYRRMAGYTTSSYGGISTVVLPELPAVTSSDNGKVLTVSNGVWSAENISSSLYAETTYSSLAALKTNSSLVPGCIYRVTDYVTKTEFSAAMSDEHAFDLLVFATSSNTLDCHAFATLNANDTYFTNAGSDLSKWQIWYDMDNDNGKYDWADSTSGKGVIYRMIDEFGNDCPYDFKNMRFTGIDGLTSGKYYYTFNLTTDSEATMSDFSLDGLHCYSNTIGEYLSGLCYYINPNVFKNTNATSFCMMNKIGRNCNGNVFGTQCYRNEISDYCVYDKFGSFCHHISFGEGSGYCAIGDYCDNITVGDLCHQVYFGSSSNSLVNYCRNITIAVNTRYFRLYDTGTASSSNYLQNIDVKAGMSGTMNTPVSVSAITRNNNYVTAVAKDSSGNTKIYCEEDTVDVWNVESIASGTTTYIITPSNIHSHIFIDNSANSSDLTVSIDTTGIDEVLREYSSLVVNAYKKARFDVKKFTQSNSVFASVKRSELVMGATGVSQFRADNISKMINAGYINSANEYMTMMNNSTVYPALFELTGVMTFNNKVYYSYSVKEYNGSSYAYLSPDGVFNAIGLVPYDFEFIDGDTLSDSVMNYPAKCNVPVSIMFYDNSHVYRNGTTSPAQMIDFTI